MNKIEFSFIIFFIVSILVPSNFLLANQENESRDIVALVDIEKEHKPLDDHSHPYALEIALRLSKREELDRLLLGLKKRKEALDSIGELKDRHDILEIERTLREEIDQLLLKIQRLATELNETDVQDLEDGQSSGWVTTTLTCSSIFLLSLLALATMDPFEGFSFLPSNKRLERNMERILGFFGY